MPASRTTALVGGRRPFSSLSARARRGIGAALVVPAFGIGGLWATGQVTVHDGDTLSAIAEANGVSVADLATVNDLTDPNLIVTGQVLTIPTPGQSTTYTVRSGDTLSAIAVRYKTTVAAVAAANGIADVNHIVVGQRIEVGGTSTPSTTKPAAVPTTTAAPAAAPAAPTTTAATAVAAPATTVAAPPTTVAPTATPTTAAPAPATTAAPTFQSGTGGPTVMTYYVVRAGDTVASVAKRFNVNAKKLAEANGLTEAAQLTVGAVLYIPGV